MGCDDSSVDGERRRGTQRVARLRGLLEAEKYTSMHKAGGLPPLGVPDALMAAPLRSTSKTACSMAWPGPRCRR